MLLPKNRLLSVTQACEISLFSIVFVLIFSQETEVITNICLELLVD